MSIFLIVGLGNPGKKFEKTRHNLGRLAVSDWQQVARFPSFKLKKKMKALISESAFAGKKVVLALPEIFMNLSGKSAKSLTTYYKILTTNLWVVHDDIDLPLGKIRISIGRSSAGHKGVQSIIDALNSKNFIRLRLGIKSEEIENRRQKIEEFVLKKFNKGEEKIIKKAIEKTAEAIEFTLKEGVERAMNRFNK